MTWNTRELYLSLTMSEELRIEINQLKLRIIDLEYENKILNDELQKKDIALVKKDLFQKKLLQIHEVFKNALMHREQTH